MAENLFDRNSILNARKRANLDDMFLHKIARDEILERLAEVNRTFTAPAIVSGFPGLWDSTLHSAKLVLDDEELALTENTHDLVVHAMCLHAANDPVGQLIQCRRALTADGLFLAICFGGETLTELRTMLLNCESRVLGGVHPRVYPMADLRDLGGLLQRAGFSMPVADSFKQQATYRQFSTLVQDLRNMGETNSLSKRSKSVSSRSLFESVDTNWKDQKVTFEFVCLAGWSPHPDQPKPLRPGSGKVHLSDAIAALKTDKKD